MRVQQVSPPLPPFLISSQGLGVTARAAGQLSTEIMFLSNTCKVFTLNYLGKGKQNGNSRLFFVIYPPPSQPSQCGRQRTLNIVHAQTAIREMWRGERLVYHDFIPNPLGPSAR